MTTLSDLILRVRQASDKVNSLFVTDAEITNWLNVSYAELWDLIIQSGEDYFTTSTTFSLAVSDNGIYSLPNGFYKLRGLDYLLGSDYITVYPYDWNERNNQTQVVNVLNGLDIRYRILGSTLRIEPRDNAQGSYQLWYIPAYTPLVSTSDTINTQISRQNWEEYMVLDVAKKILDKEESESSHLFQAKEVIRQRINEFAGTRDVDQPVRISNTRGGRYYTWWRRGSV